MTVPRLYWFSAVALAAALQASAQQAPPSRSSSAQPQAQSALVGDASNGRYIVEHIAMCVECHSSRDAQGNIIPETRFMGGEIPFRPPWAGEWATRAPRNAGLPGYTNETAMRLLTEGAIDRRGVQLKPPMPRFRMTPQDAADVIAFMRSLT
jgi:mono/diheme cytochrome c family protein